ncbi:MAG: alpha/beta hydrolase [Flavobacteriales bacterium]|nr:alpha/beta hydrolase [Flavobacteriales bacterium]
MSANFLFRGAQISYTTKGKGRCIVLIHGFLGSKEIWNDYQKRLSKKFKVVCIDLAGHGESECIGYVHNMELLAESIKALLKHLNVRKTVIAGHSLGGYVSLAFAEKYPDSVLGLMLINSSAKGDNSTRRQSRNQLIDLVKKDRKRAIELLVPGFFNLKKRNTTWQIKRYLKYAHNCSERGIIASIEGMKLRKEREIVLKFAPFPFIYLIGKYDSIFPEENLIEESNLGEKGSHFILEESSHMSLMEEQEKVYRYLKEFAS